MLNGFNFCNFLEKKRQANSNKIILFKYCSLTKQSEINFWKLRFKKEILKA